MSRARMFVVSLVLMFSTFAFGQDGNPPITNADVVSMAKAGIGEQTIVLSIKKARPSSILRHRLSSN